MEQVAPGVAQSPSHPAQHMNGAGSTESTPKSSQNNTGADWDEPLPQVPGAKLRLMCSYGGHIIPRPHDKTLCYVGGDTRIVAVDRNSSFTDLCTRLSRSLLDGRRFTLKYQLPNEDLDSLISVATDEDLENMVEEYDRLTGGAGGGGAGGVKVMSRNSSSSSSGSRIRLFMFFTKPETAQTMGALLDDAKSETWFVDALNGADVLPRGVSDTAVIDDLLSLGSTATDHDQGLVHVSVACSDGAVRVDNVARPVVASQDVQSVQSIMQDSPMMETTSSFDSTTSSPSIAHLPPIRVRVDDLNGPPRFAEGGFEDQFSTQLRVTPPLPTTILTQCTTTTTPANVNVGVGVGQNEHSTNRVVSDDERSSDFTAPVASRKPPLPLPIPPMQQRVNTGFNMSSPDSKHAGVFNLPSPDSVTSDNSSIASTTSFTKVPLQQDSGTQYTTPVDHTKLSNMNTNTDPTTNENPAPTPQTQTYMYPPPPQEQHHQPQFVQTNMHYMPTQPPIQSYYPFYPNHPNHQVDPQQYPMYLLPVPQTQPYNLAIQPNDPTGVSSMVQPSSVTHVHPTMYPTRAVAPAPQFQPQYAAYSSVARPAEGGAGVNYGNDNHYQPLHQVYYTGQMAPTATAAANTATPIIAGSQYQSMTPAQAVMIAEASMQLSSADNSMQQARTS